MEKYKAIQLKIGKKIKYENGIYCGKPIVEVGYLVSVDESSNWAFVAPTKKACNEGLGHYVPVRDIIC